MSLVKTQFESGVATVTLCRSEKRNALSRELLSQLSSAVKSTLTNSESRLLVLKAEGSVFCAGMDLAEMQQRASSADGPQEWLKDSQDYCDLLISIYSASIPSVACLQGPVLAGGVGIVLACDFVLAAENAFFALPEPQRGITAAMVTPLLAHRIGAGRAAHLLLSGQRLDVASAQQMGLVFETADSDGLDEAASNLASSILSGSPDALAITRQHLDDVSGGNLVQKLRESIDVSAKARATEDAREGLAAFLEKRKPSWQE
jgi:methylglutaconyl-CoA hydratase